METLVPISPAEVRPIPLTQTGMEQAKCASPSCKWTFTQGCRFVPDRYTMYEQIRDSDVDSAEPLNRSEVLGMEFCSNCKRRFEEAGIQMFPTMQALEQNAQWVEENRRVLEAQRREANQRAYEARKSHVHGDDRSEMNQLFAHAKPHGEKHKKPGQRRKRH